jgi:hypothetical protein
LTDCLYSEIGLEDLCITSMNLKIETKTETAGLKGVLAATRIAIIRMCYYSEAESQALTAKSTVGLHTNRET